MNRLFSRRLVLRGAGVALTLPWLESLLSTKEAQAQASLAPKRFMPIFLPNGASHDAADYWRPSGVGVGAAWTLSPILDVFAELKAKMNVISDFENGSVFNESGSSSVEPSHGRQPGAWPGSRDCSWVAGFQRSSCPGPEGANPSPVHLGISSNFRLFD